MSWIAPAVIFSFNGLTPGLYTKRILQSADFGVKDVLVFNVVYARGWGHTLPAITVQTYEIGFMGDPATDPNNTYHRFPFGSLSHGLNINMSPQEFSVVPSDLFFYVRINGTAAATARYLLHMSALIEVRPNDDARLRHALPTLPIRTATLAP
jgi:hypothetical protein